MGEDFPYYDELVDTLQNAGWHAIWSVDRSDEERERLDDMCERMKFAELWNIFKAKERYIFGLRMKHPVCDEYGCCQCMVWDPSKKDLVDPSELGK
jgi:hypothetical protein